MTTVRLQHPFRIGEFLRAYAITMRPYLLFVSGITGIAGLAHAGDVPPLRGLLAASAAFLSYGFGQALTDCFQIDTDRLSSPYRPLTQGLIRKEHVLLTSVAGLIVCVGVLTVLHPMNLPLGLLAGAGLATYTPFKRVWWGGPWYNAWIVSVLCVMGYLAGHGPGAPPPSISFILTLATVFFGYANFVLSGYFKDIAADAASGYRTAPVVFGRTASALASNALAAFGAAAMAGAFFSTPDRISLSLETAISWVFLGLALGAGVRAQFLLHRVTSDEDAHPSIALVVHAYILGLSALASAAMPDLALPLVAYYACFILVLRARPCRSQI